MTDGKICSRERRENLGASVSRLGRCEQMSASGPGEAEVPRADGFAGLGTSPAVLLGSWGQPGPSHDPACSQNSRC